MTSSELDLPLRTFIGQSGITFDTVSEALGDNLSNIFKWWNRPGERFLRPRHLENLAFYLGTSEDDIVRGNLDIELARHRFIEGPTTSRDEYFSDAFSYTRTSVHIIKFLKYSIGRRRTDKLLREMGVHPCLFSSYDNRINLRFFVDLLAQVEAAGITKEVVHSLSMYMFLTLLDTPLGHQFQQAKSYQECYQVLKDNIDRFDRNFEYKVEITESEVRIEAVPGDIVGRMLIDEKVRLDDLIHYRKNMVGWFPYLSGLAPIVVKLERSVIFGEDRCVFVGHFPEDKSSGGSSLVLVD